MDERLGLFNGQRVSRLLKQDVPLLVRALIAVLRNRAHFGAGRRKGVGYVRFWDAGFSLVVLQEDWELIFPFIEDGTLNPILNPSSRSVGYLNPSVSFKESVLDQADRYLYMSMVGLLEPLFPEAYPTP